MKIKALKIKHFKGIKDLEISDLGEVNLFIGKNNSGKTSLLEALVGFFDSKAFPTKFSMPPNTTHYDKDGNEYKDTQISLLFDLPEDFLDNEAFGDEQQKKLLKKIIDKGIWVTRGLNVASEFPSLSDTDIKFSSGISPDWQSNFFSYFKQKLKERYGNLGTKFIPSFDWLREYAVNGEEYNDIVYQGREARVRLRGSLTDIFSNLKSVHESDQYQRVVDFLERVNKTFPREFSKITERLIGRGGMIEFGEKGRVKSLQYSNQGSGEIEMLEMLWILDPFRFKKEDHPEVLYLIDEPENHKHFTVQRILLERILEISNPSQFFISTHSPVFASKYWHPSVRVYLITYNKEEDVTKTKLITTMQEGVKIKEELGFLNIYNFFSNAVLYVEGETEIRIIPAILRFFGKDLISLGIRIESVDGVDNVKEEKLQQALQLLEETQIIPVIMLDNESNAEKSRKKILTKHKNLFSKKEIQYHLWMDNFVDSLPYELVFKAFENLLLDQKISKKKIKRRKSEFKKIKKDVENHLMKIFHEETGRGLSKPELGDYIAKEILLNIGDEELKKNAVFKHVFSIIDYVESINN